MTKIILLDKETEKANVVELLQQRNAYIIIRDDITFATRTIINIDASSVLNFEGGSLDNCTLGGVVRFNDACYQIFKEEVSFDSRVTLCVPHLRPEWFGARSDYDPSAHSGTDSAAAINRTIALAEELSVRKIVFSTGNYYVRSSIEINRGDIWLDGPGSLLREERFTKEANATESCTGAIFCRNVAGNAGVTSCIICKKMVSNPIKITNLQFCNDSGDLPAGIRNSGITVGFLFTSDFIGPTWPVIFRYCHFENFDKAIYIHSVDIGYCIHDLMICDCSFKNNRYCLDSAPYNWSKNYKNGPTLYCSWKFIFENNRCHSNGIIVHFCIQKGLCRIVGNNCEGTLQSGDNAYAIDIELAQHAHAVIEDNHFEGNKTKLVKVVGYWGIDSQVTALHNNTDGMQDNVYNTSYFENVVLDTDLNSEILSCIFVTALKRKAKDIHKSIDKYSLCFMKDWGNWIPAKNYTRKEISPLGGTPTFVETPTGRRLFAFFPFTLGTPYYVNVFDSFLDYGYDPKESQLLKYLNIEFPFYRRQYGQVFVNMKFTISAHYVSEDSGDACISTSYQSLICYASSGLFRTRFSVNIWDYPDTKQDPEAKAELGKNTVQEEKGLRIGSLKDADKKGLYAIEVKLDIVTEGIAPSEHEGIYIGRPVVALTKEAVDLNFSFIENADLVSQ